MRHLRNEGLLVLQLVLLLAGLNNALLLLYAISFPNNPRMGVLGQIQPRAQGRGRGVVDH